MGVSRLGEGDGAAETDVEAQFQKSVHFLGGAAPAVHHPGRTATDRLTASEFLKHWLGRISTVNDHWFVEFNRQVQLGAEHIKLLIKVLVSVQIKTKFTDRHHARIGLCRLSQLNGCGCRPMLGVKRMDAHRVTHFGETICQGADRWDLTRLNTGMQEGHHSSFTPSRSNIVEIFLEITEDNVTVAVDELWSRQGDLKRAFRSIVMLFGD
jgi:hypothetical protein